MARLKEKTDRSLRESYVMDTIRMISESTAKVVRGTYMAKRFDELRKKQDARTAEEIASEIIKKAGLVVK